MSAHVRFPPDRDQIADISTHFGFRADFVVKVIVGLARIV